MSAGKPNFENTMEEHFLQCIQMFTLNLHIESYYMPDIDLFASRINTQVDKFVS